MRPPIKAKHYKHGDENEDMPGTFYCAACDVFMEGHLAGDARDPVDVHRHVAAALRAGAFARRYRGPSS